MADPVVKPDDQTTASPAEYEMIIPKSFLEKILALGALSDLSVICDGYKFQLHRLVVGVKAPELTILEDNAVIPNINAITFSRVLRFLYLDEYDNTSTELVGNAERQDMRAHEDLIELSPAHIGARADPATSLEPDNEKKDKAPNLRITLPSSAPASDASFASETPDQITNGSRPNTPRTASSLNPSAKPYEPKVATPSSTKFEESYYGDAALYIAATRLQIPALCTVSLFQFQKNFKHAVLEATDLENIINTIDLALKVKIRGELRGAFDLRHVVIGILACAHVERSLDEKIVAAVRSSKPETWRVVEEMTIKCREKCEAGKKAIVVRNQLESSNSKATIKADVLATRVEQAEDMCRRLATANEALRAELLKLQTPAQKRAAQW